MPNKNNRTIFFLSPKKISRNEMERAILGGGRSFQFNGRTLRGLAYRLHRRTCYTKKEPPRRISEVLKVAATRSVLPLIGRSGLRLEGHASLLFNKEFYVRATVRATRTRAAHLLLRTSPGPSRCASIASPAQRSAVPSAMLSLCPVPSPLRCSPAPSPARRRRAHRRPPRATPMR